MTLARTNGHTVNGYPKKAKTPDPLAVPSRTDLEPQVVGAMIVAPEQIAAIRVELSPDDFFDDECGQICRAIYKRYDAGLSIDSWHIDEALLAIGMSVERVKELSLETMPDRVVISKALEYARIVRAYAKRRAIITAAKQTVADAYDLTEDIEALTFKVECRFLEITQTRAASKPEPIGVLAAKAIGQIHQQQEGVKFGMPTGFRDLDAQLGGCIPNQALMVIAARPSMGKSALALNICENVSIANNRPSLFVTLEMSGVNLAQRALSGRSGIDGGRMRAERNLDDGELALLGRLAARMKDAPLYVLDIPYLDMAKMASFIRADCATRGTGLVVVDYLGLIRGLGDDTETHSRQEVVSELANRCKALARELDIPIILACQLNRQNEARSDKRPQLHDLRESGAIEQDADIVALLHRPERYDRNDSAGIAEIEIAKWRNGACGRIRLAFNGLLTKFDDMQEGPF